ncbi:hypothetical protein CIB84_000664 [Bambusicola thoracicus]|uniref:Uncharacterized protein n=1 Tax=Bambusicola thoracicus TaxID=9083 RepID=A0A2P4TGU0_BAMTH|nr:hypothetical protein CIB84_000664 [Bambusicola thoracicus]
MKDNLKGINCLVCSVLVLPLVLLVDFVALYFGERTLHTWRQPFKKLFYGPR